MILLPDTARGHNQHCLCPCQPGAVETTPPGSQFQVGCTCLTGQNPSYPFLTVIPALWAHIAKVARVIFQRLDPDPGPKLGLSVSNLRKKWKFVTFCFRISLFWYILLLFSFKFENQTPVQTPSTINATEFQKCFYLSNGLKNQANSCYFAENQKWLWVRKSAESFQNWLWIHGYFWHILSSFCYLQCYPYKNKLMFNLT